MGLLGAVASVAAPSNQACNQRRNDTVAKLLECIRASALVEHLQAFQQIADRNPGPQGHGNRNTGSRGYLDSVEYVAGLMRQAGYRVTVQPYNYTAFEVVGAPALSVAGHALALDAGWNVARLSGSGSVAAVLQPVGLPAGGRRGCVAGDFVGFVPGRIALIERGDCDLDVPVALAEAAQAAGVILFNAPDAAAQNADRGGDRTGGAFQAHLHRVAGIPVIGVMSNALGADWVRQAQAGGTLTATLDVRTRIDPRAVDYNLIAESPYGDPNHVVVVDAHLDAIHGAGILDNASGSATILEVALKLARTPTRHQLRYIWFGGEELGLFGSAYYTQHLTWAQWRRIVFDIDADVTATPNYAILVADPQNAYNAHRFPPNVVPQSRRGNQYFLQFFQSVGVPAQLAGGGNNGTDSNSFSLVGIPNTGIFTQQDCCKTAERVALWGGSVGNYEGHVPGFDGGCVDFPHRWCDNIDNTSADVMELVSRSVAYVTFKLANDPTLRPAQAARP